MKEQGCFNGGFSGFIVVLVYYYPSRDFGAPKMEVAFEIQTKLVRVPNGKLCGGELFHPLLID